MANTQQQNEKNNPAQNNPAQDAGKERAHILVYEEAGNHDHIEVRDVEVRVPGRHDALVRDVNFTVQRGDRVLLTGESGSGKTTFVKAVLNMWNHGQGRVLLPEGARVMVIAQQVYLPNTDLRSILNMAPQGEERFADRDLRDALIQVGLPRLVQHIPGQQVQILMDDVLAGLQADLQGSDAAAAQEKACARIDELVAAQFEVVQFVRDEERGYFAEGLKALAATLPEAAKVNAGALIDRMDIALAQPLARAAEAAAANYARDVQLSRLMPYGPRRAAAFARDFDRQLAQRFTRYLKNEDTEDPSREVRLNALQAAHVRGRFSAAMEEQMQITPHRSPLRVAFNAVSLPVRLLARVFAMSAVPPKTMREVMFNVAAFMEAQIVRGDRLSGRLSGGQKKMLVAASVLLAKPDVLLLDEITSGLDAKNGVNLYGDIMKAIPQNSIVISVMHHEDQFLRFHTHHARVANGTVSVAPVTPAPRPA